MLPEKKLKLRDSNVKKKRGVSAEFSRWLNQLQTYMFKHVEETQEEHLLPSVFELTGDQSTEDYWWDQWMASASPINPYRRESGQVCS